MRTSLISLSRRLVDTKMTDQVKHVEHRLAKAGLVSAAASGDPAVQKALAELQTAQMNRDALVVVEKAELDAADAAVAKAKKDLVELGYE
jgi:hypothetical protein